MRSYIAFGLACAILLVIMFFLPGCGNLGGQRCMYVSGFTCINPY